MTDRESSGQPGNNDTGNHNTGSEDPAARRRNAKRQGLAYQGAFEAVAAILIAAGIGYWADSRFGTTPWCLLGGVVIGFASFVLRLLRLGRQLQELRAEAGSDAAD